MKVAIMFSGGKDSTFAIDKAIKKGWDVRYLISIKPTRTDCYLFHYATVEHTKELAKMLKMPHILESCSVADAEKEAQIVRNIVEKKQKSNPVNAVVLGGTGLQETQLRSIQNALRPLGIEVFASHAGEEHDLVIDEMLNSGYEIMITQVASDGLMPWLGKTITKENFTELRKDSVKYKFHIGFEGGYADTLVLDCPLFSKKLKAESFDKIIEDKYSGHIVINKLTVLDKKEKIRAQ
ncbi:diphthine--ammonia ligase [Candidatus Woesearchaeota archaeon]|nr:diphthine--ammonia ligase [Candidatus Woesearchaeota archaeon]